MRKGGGRSKKAIESVQRRPQPAPRGHPPENPFNLCIANSTPLHLVRVRRDCYFNEISLNDAEARRNERGQARGERGYRSDATEPRDERIPSYAMRAPFKGLPTSHYSNVC